MEKPYCVVDGKEYQLVYSEHGTLRFPDNGNKVADLNELHMEYIRGEVNLEVLWEYYTNSGSSFESVEGLFSMYGMNSHTVTNGKGKFKEFELFTENKELNSYYSPDNVSPLEILNVLNENEKYFTELEKVQMKLECTMKLIKEVKEYYELQQ